MKDIVKHLLSSALETLQSAQTLPDFPRPDIKIDHSKDATHGDFASNLAMVLAKPCQMPPRKLAELLCASLPEHPSLKKVEIAGPGFINFFMAHDAVTEVVKRIFSEKNHFGHCNLGRGEKVYLEFVSANPTGPLHVGHGRGAAFGASLANLLNAAGYQTHREYYVNDAGRQMNILAVSVWLRYLELLGENIIFPANGYRGDYVRDIARLAQDKYHAQYQHSWHEISADLHPDEPQGGDKEAHIDALIATARQLLGCEGFKCFHQLALHEVLEDIKDDLGEFGVQFDTWFSEQTLFDEGDLDNAIAALKKSGHTYEKDGALWFAASEFGDEKDRVLVKANGDTTYFAADSAYHWHKFEKGFARVIDIFGADHHGYVSRMRAAMRALGHNDETMDMLLVQFAILYRSGKRVQMSTRSGSFVTLRELRNEVGTDAARFFYVTRKPEQHLDFDLDLAKSQSSDNPVYYIQYAHARICSVMRQLKERGMHWDEQQGLNHLELLTEPHEQALIKTLSRYPEMIQSAARDCEPHQIAYYLRELANNLHSYYNAVQLLCENEAERCARLCLLHAVRQVLRNGLTLIGVSSPESM